MIQLPHTTLILGQEITALIIQHPLFSALSWIGLLLMVGTLLAEYTLVNSEGHYERPQITPDRKKKRNIMWLLFLLFLLLVMISR